MPRTTVGSEAVQTLNPFGETHKAATQPPGSRASPALTQPLGRNRAAEGASSRSASVEDADFAVAKAVAASSDALGGAKALTCLSSDTARPAAKPSERTDPPAKKEESRVSADGDASVVRALEDLVGDASAKEIPIYDELVETHADATRSFLRDLLQRMLAEKAVELAAQREKVGRAGREGVRVWGRGGGATLTTAMGCRRLVVGRVGGGWRRPGDAKKRGSGTEGVAGAGGSLFESACVSALTGARASFGAPALGCAGKVRQGGALEGLDHVGGPHRRPAASPASDARCGQAHA